MDYGFDPFACDNHEQNLPLAFAHINDILTVAFTIQWI